jgi:hypothetical protein
VTAVSRAAVTVTCDHPGCGEHARSDGPASGLRRALRVRGWAVNLPSPVPGARQPRLDFCAGHAESSGR